MTSKNYKEEIEVLVARAISDGASDIHLSAGLYPTFRVSGSLVPLMNLSTLTPEDTMGILSQLITPDFMQRFLVNREIDFSYDFHNKGRFRGSAFFQKNAVGIALRAIPTQVKTISE